MKFRIWALGVRGQSGDVRAANDSARAHPQPVDASEASPRQDVVFDLSSSIRRHAARIGIDAAVGAAVFEVESGGQMFVDLPEPHGRKVTARFEVHVFWKTWGQYTSNVSAFDRFFSPKSPTQWKGHRYFDPTSQRWIMIHVDEFDEAQRRSWDAIDLANVLAGGETTLQCASFGGPQIMGFNHARCGYPTATAMVAAFNDPDNQVGALFDFIRTGPELHAAAQNKFWKDFALYYNGSGQVNAYAARLAAAYKKHKDRSTHE